MSTRRRLLVAGGAAGAAGAAWAVTLRADRRRVAADPAHDPLWAPFGGRERTVTSADGTELAVREHGPQVGPALVFVHGWTCAQKFWTLQVQGLAPEHRVVTFDLRGHGDSAPATGRDYSIEAHAADLDAVLAATAGDERAVVAGHSLGAMTIVAWAGGHAEEVDRRLAAAALIDTGMGDLISESLVVRTPKAFDAVSTAVGRVVLSASAPIPGPTPLSFRAIRHAVLSPSASPAAVAFCEELIMECPADVRAAVGGTLSRLDLRESVAALSVPTVVLAGEADRLTPPAHAERLAETLPELADHIVLPGSGHMSPVSDPDPVTDALRRLVREHAAAPATA
jgi:pimeloyl-ACP methyl ester carboxylesterase